MAWILTALTPSTLTNQWILILVWHFTEGFNAWIPYWIAGARLWLATLICIGRLIWVKSIHLSTCENVLLHKSNIFRMEIELIQLIRQRVVCKVRISGILFEFGLIFSLSETILLLPSLEPRWLMAKWLLARLECARAPVRGGSPVRDLFVLRLFSRRWRRCVRVRPLGQGYSGCSAFY